MVKHQPVKHPVWLIKPAIVKTQHVLRSCKGRKCYYVVSVCTNDRLYDDHIMNKNLIDFSKYLFMCGNQRI